MRRWLAIVLLVLLVLLGLAVLLGPWLLLPALGAPPGPGAAGRGPEIELLAADCPGTPAGRLRLPS